MLITWKFLVAILLHAGSCSVFPTLNTDFQLTLHLIRAERTGQLSKGEIYARFLCKYNLKKKKKTSTAAVF